jgi:inorganic pyrophosphatase
MASQYTVRQGGAPNTLDHRVYIEKDGVPVSPFHDIPLFANQEQTILNMIVEIPRWTNAKLEVRPPVCLLTRAFAFALGPES